MVALQCQYLLYSKLTLLHIQTHGYTLGLYTGLYISYTQDSAVVISISNIKNDVYIY